MQSSQPQMKTDYYELLEVEKTATQDEINKAYKKAALKWHPDKNQGQDTTKIFQDLREAYTVLSDPNERAWYDNHKDQILRGKDPEEDKEEDQSYITKSKLWPFFSQSCFSGYSSQKENNFYKVYGDLFRQLDKEEENEEEVGEEHYDAPWLGDENSTAEEVFRFYNHWQHFSTLKSFAYADKYNPNQAPNRRVKRIIETENKKERNQEKKEFNDQVIQLVEYVKKRDPRYQKFKAQEQRDKELKRQMEEEIKQKKRQEEQEKLRKYREEVAKKYAEQEEEALQNGDYEEVVVHEYPCGVCKKVFKNEKQMQNHLQSKKHKDNYAKFKETVQLDDETEKEIQKLEEEKKKQEEEKEEQRRKENAKEYEKEEKKKTRKNQKQQSEDEEEEKSNTTTTTVTEEQKEEGQLNEKEEEEEYVSRNKKKKMTKQPSAKGGKNVVSSGTTIKEQFKKLDKNEQDELIKLVKQREEKAKKGPSGKGSKKTGKKGVEWDDEEQDDKDDEEFFNKGKAGAKKQPNKSGPTKANSKKQQEGTPSSKKEEEKQTESDKKDEEVKVQEESKTTKEEQKSEAVQQQEAAAESDGDNDEDDGDQKPSKKQKRKEKKSKKEQEQKQTSLKCNICKTDFETRNQLFTHIKQTGHARAV